MADDRTFTSFWREHLSTRKRRVLFVLGQGFDPRALSGLRQIVDLGSTPEAWLLAFDNGLDDSPLRVELTQKNKAQLIRLLGEEQVSELPLAIGGPSAVSVTSRNTVRLATQRTAAYESFDDVVVDISAMPRMVALTIVAKILHDLDERQRDTGHNVNLHAIVAESVATDLQVRGGLRDEVSTVQGFSGQLTGTTSEHWPHVWFPVLGEGQRDRLVQIRSHINPDEICPVIPFPARQPRRGDELVMEHRETLFDDFLVEPSNILRAPEYNPFEAYKRLFQVMDRYRRALDELDGCKAFVSPLSSKLLSIGALLACYDHKHGSITGTRLKVGLPYVETARSYEEPNLDSAGEFELYSMWIRGEWET